MNKTPKLWEILAAFIPVITGIVIWLWNLGIKVKEQEKDIQYLQANQIEYKQDVRQIKETMNTILLKLENKKDRDK
jgi:uncharacterized coiled-coil protein SlyX